MLSFIGEESEWAFGVVYLRRWWIPCCDFSGEWGFWGMVCIVYWVYHIGAVELFSLVHIHSINLNLLIKDYISCSGVLFEDAFQ